MRTHTQTTNQKTQELFRGSHIPHLLGKACQAFSSFVLYLWITGLNRQRVSKLNKLICFKRSSFHGLDVLFFSLNQSQSNDEVLMTKTHLGK